MPEDDDISPFVRHLMPDADEEALRRATICFRAFFEVLYQEFLRREALRTSAVDKSGEPAMVEGNHLPDV